jgi:hypothetical protein
VPAAQTRNRRLQRLTADAPPHPPCLHACCADALSERAGEITYIPVYDCTGSAQGIVAVLELVVSRRSDDVMVVANVISCVAELMGALQVRSSALSLPAARQAGGHHAARVWQAASAPLR